MENRITVEKSQTIEVTIDSTTKQSFKISQQGNDAKNIEDGMVYGVIVHNATQLPISPKGAATVNDTVRKKSYLRLATGLSTRTLDVLDLPCYLLDPSLNSGTPFLFSPRKVALSSSSFELPTVAGLLANEAFVITFLYR